MAFSESVNLEVEVVPDPATIEITQRVVGDLSSRLASDDDTGWRIAMAAHEPLDNARKYGLDRLARLELRIRGGAVELFVHSRGAPEMIETMAKLVDEMSRAEDPWAFYVDALRAAGARESEGSGVGLARIKAEGEMAVSIARGENGRVAVGATLALEAAP